MTPITESREQKDNGNVFNGYCARVTDVQDMSQVITYLVSNKPDVTKTSHVIYACWLKGTRGKILENFDPDRGCGNGHELLQMMRAHNMVNIICIAKHMCNIGFRHINELFLRAYNVHQ